MTIFSRDFQQKKSRLSILLFGIPKVGKTRTILDLAKKGEYVVLFSTDHGTLEIYRNPELYKGHLVLAEVYTLQDMRKAIEEGRNDIRRIIKAGVDPSKIWACIDTLTHLQIILMMEARKISTRNPDSKADKDEYVRDMMTQVDWGINLSLMSELANGLNSYPCNIVNVALESESRGQGRPRPSISGQSRDRFTGDADLILRMVPEKGTGRKILTSALDGAGDRSGVLEEIEEPDLAAIRDKIYLNENVVKPNQEKGSENDQTAKSN